MLLLSDLVGALSGNMPTGWVVSTTDLERWIKTAVRFYCGYADLVNDPLDTDGIHTAIDATDNITGDQDFELTPSEWAIIQPLFMLYVERQNAMDLEASRAMGLEVYGRSVAEVQTDIKELQERMPHDAFSEMPQTV